VEDCGVGGGVRGGIGAGFDVFDLGSDLTFDKGKAAESPEVLDKEIGNSLDEAKHPVVVFHQCCLGTDVKSRLMHLQTKIWFV